MDEHHARQDRGELGLLNTRPARLSIRVPDKVPELDEQTLAFNADTAGALTRTSVDGDVPRMYANDLKQAGADGRTTVLDLVDQVNNAEGRDRADDDAVPLFSRAATGSKMEAIAMAKRPIPGSGDILTVPIDFPVQEGQQAPAQTQQIQLAGGPALAALPWLMGGAAVTGGAIAQQQIQQQMKKSQSQQTTVADPQAGKPQVMPGADPSKAQVEQGTPGLEPPKALPPVPGRSSEAPVQGSSFPGQPAEPVAPMEPLEIKNIDEITHDMGGKPHPDSEKGLEAIPEGQCNWGETARH